MNRYETHLTLAARPLDDLAAIAAWAECSGVKWTQIVLESGETPLQPMLTFWGSGSLADQMQQADAIRQKVSRLNGAVVRIKVEADVNNDDVPQSDHEAGADLATYFEHHVKVLIPNSDTFGELGPITHACGARLSRNSRRRRADGAHERFVTQRIYRRGKKAAAERLDLLQSSIRRAGFEILEVEAEYVVFDSNLNLDRGWIEPDGGGQDGTF